MDSKTQCIRHDLTHIEVKEYVYTWSVSNFKFYHCEVGKGFASPLFTTGESNEYKWRLHVYPYGVCDEESKGYVSVYLASLNLGLSTASAPKKTAYLIISLVNKNGDESVVTDEKHFDIEYQNAIIRRFPKFVKRSFILNKNNGLLPNDELTIRCKMYFTKNPVDCPYPTDIVPSADQKISSDYEQLLDNEMFSDIKLVVDHEVMLELLRFIYSGKVNNIKLIAGDLLVAAEKYQLDGLKAMCEEALIRNLTLENVGNVLQIADGHNADALKKAAVNFVTNNAKHLVDSVKFQAEMTSFSPLLSAEIIKVFMRKQ